MKSCHLYLRTIKLIQCSRGCNGKTLRVVLKLYHLKDWSEDAVNDLHAKLSSFKTDCFVKRMQENNFDQNKSGIEANRVVLKVDFAENYSAISQDEVESAHWNHSQVNVFTNKIVAGRTAKSELYACVVLDDESSSSDLDLRMFDEELTSSQKLSHDVYPDSEEVESLTSEDQEGRRYVHSYLCGGVAGPLIWSWTSCRFVSLRYDGKVKGQGGMFTVIYAGGVAASLIRSWTSHRFVSSSHDSSVKGQEGRTYVHYYLCGGVAAKLILTFLRFLEP
ncbi:hypothetical protein PR048_002060 [Dryococelus australis]|uniref:Uncharacterized protein n=1 Tax=Dryococelus australis TaxID=614101 RepID=A0ABQ9IJ56_9NEOP|nr:hypothetical protein PR048_002060 [Dryococelus australis]